MTPDLTYPLPPLDRLMPAGPQHIMLAFGGVVCLLLAIHAGYLAVRTRSLIPPFILIGGLLAVIFEPAADILEHCLHPVIGQLSAFTSHGRPMPVHVVLVYPVYLCVLPLLLWRRIVAGTLDRAFLWRLAGLLLLIAAVFEQWMIRAGVWIYYGDHSLRIGYMPVWITCVNVAAVMTPMLLIYRLLPRLSGWKQLLVVPMMPLALTASHLGAGIFMVTVLGMHQPLPPLPFLAMLATIAMSALMLWIMIELCGGERQSPRTTS